MNQLRTLAWLKWTLFRNSLRSSKAVVNRIASLLTLSATLVLALAIAAGLGITAYALTTSHEVVDAMQATDSIQTPAPISPEFIFFTIFAFLYLVWATLPLSIGSSKQFAPGRFLLYPISLRRLFVLDLISEVTTLQSVVALPSILAIALGAGLGTHKMIPATLAAIPAIVFGIALSKWLATTIGYLTRKRRTRGETLIALIGAIAGLGGALVGQIAPVLFRHAGSVSGLRWTPPGAAAYAFTDGLQTDLGGFLLAVATLALYGVVLIVATYWLARRAALGIDGRRRSAVVAIRPEIESYAGWELPLLSPETSAVIEKELRYITRNAQLRMMALMPFILIVVRFMNTSRLGRPISNGSPFNQGLSSYAGVLLPTAGVLYVFLILAGLSCNQFAFEEGGMRTLVLAPVARKKILIGKNIALSLVALVFSTVLLIINQLVFHDLTPGVFLFVVLSFVTFACLMSIIGNWLSVRFPKRMQFGKRLNVSGVVGLLLIPMVLMLALPPFAAVAAGYLTQSFVIEYVTLSLCATLALGSYLLIIGSQGESLQRQEANILEVVREPANQ